MAVGDGRRRATKRRWRGAVVGTVVLQLSYIPLVLVWQAAIGGADLDAQLLGQALGFGLGVMPLVFISLAYASVHRRAPTAVLKAMGLWILIGGPLLVAIGPIVGATAGYVAGGIVTLRSDFGPRATQLRVVTAVAVVVVVLVLTLAVPLAGAVVGGIAPFTSLAYSDHRVAATDTVDDDKLLEE